MLKETFVYTSFEKLRNLRELCSLSKIDENLIRVVACEPDEPVCKDESCDSFGQYVGRTSSDIPSHLPVHGP